MMHRPPQNGFTLVETLVAISILLVSIVGPMYSVFQAVQTTYVARDQLIATALAQEGIEYVQHRRDSNYQLNVQTPATPVNWLNGLAPCETAAGCMVDVIAPEGQPPVTCSGACSPLNLVTGGTANGYTYGGGTPTRFTRTVKVNVVSANEATVTSNLSWIDAHVPYSITVTEDFYNWL